MLWKTAPDSYSSDWKSWVAVGWESGMGNRQFVRRSGTQTPSKFRLCWMVKFVSEGTTMPGHKDICKPEQPACSLSATKLSASVNPTIARYSHVVGWSLIRWWTMCWCRSVATFQASLWTVPVCAAIVVSWTTHRSPYQFWPGEQQLVVFLQLHWQALADSKQRRRTSHSYLVPGISLLVYFVISYL